MTTVVISQPMFLPWVGLFEQIAVADIFVHYDDVQMPRGRSFMSRVQVKTATGPKWLSAPIERARSGPLISQKHLASNTKWRETHLNTLYHVFGGRPYRSYSLGVADEIYRQDTTLLSEFNIFTIEMIARELGLSTRFLRSSELNIPGKSSARLISICGALGGTRYVTGHGALNYLDHAAFEAAGVAVEYMDYSPRPWPQPFGEFTPYVTTLDLLAALPPDKAAACLNPATLPWRQFKASHTAPQ